MKRLLWIFIVSVGVFACNAQKSSGFEFSGNIGWNSSVASSLSGVLTTSELSSYNVAFGVEYYFSDRWGLKSKLIYDKKGWGDGFIIEPGSIITTTDIELTYITIPVMANWHFGSTRKWYLHFGFFTGFLLDAQAKATGDDIQDTVKSIDFGLAVGVGYKFPVSEKTKLFVEYDGQSGIVRVLENSSGYVGRNTRVSINLGVIFDL